MLVEDTLPGIVRINEVARHLDGICQPSMRRRVDYHLLFKTQLRIDVSRLTFSPKSFVLGF